MEYNSDLWGPQSTGADRLKKWTQLPVNVWMLLWGWSQCLTYFRFFFVRVVSFSYVTCKVLEYLTNGIAILLVIFSFYYLWVHRSWFKHRQARSLLAVWVAWFLGMVFTNLVICNVLHQVVFELQHVLFMLYTAVAILVMGLLINDRGLRVGGIAFAACAFAASYLSLKYQMGLEALGWLLGLVIPGHLRLKRLKH
jgi:hypothetical protein